MKPFLALLLLPALTPFADDERFDLWRFPLPEGWTKTSTKGHFALTRIDGGEFCQIAVYVSRAPLPEGIEAEYPKEWKEVVEATFKTGPATKMKERRLASGVVARWSAAEFRDKQDASWYGALYLLAPYGQVVSIVVTSNTAETLEKYDPVVIRFLDSLKLEVGDLSRQAAAKAGGVGKVAPVPGKYATSRSGNFDLHLNGLHHGYDKRQYDFKEDHRYTFHLEAWGGSYRSDEYLLIDEAGTWALDGNTLTLTPASGTSVVQNRAGEIQKKVDPRLETTTYFWSFHYFEGLKETNLVLTPPGETARDGAFASNPLFSRSYLLDAKYAPEWTKFGK